MIRVAGIARSGDRGGHPPPSAPSSSSSSSTLSPLAPPFTVDRSILAVTNPNSLPPPPPAGAVSPYFVTTGDSSWSSSSSSTSSRLTNLKSGFGAVGASRYYPYYATVIDSMDGTLDNVSDYKGYARGWGGTIDLEEGMPPRGSLANSSWMDSLSSSQMSSALKKRAIADSFSAYEDSFGSWHGAHNESSSIIGRVGSECSEWLDDRHRGIYAEKSRATYAEKSRAPADGSCAAKLETTVWPNEGSSYFYSPETTSVVKECDTFIPSSYDRYISQLISCSRDPIVHYSAPTSSRQEYAPSNERNESLLSCSVLKHGNPVIKHVNLHKKNGDYADYVIGMQNETSIYENAEGKEGLEKMDISGDAMQRTIENPGPSLPVKGLSSGNCSALKRSVDCLEDVKFGLKVATNSSSCNASNSERDAFMPDDSMQTSLEISDHLNVAVDSPCWRGASVRQHPFSSDETLQSLVVSVVSGSDDLINGHRSLKIQSDVEQDGTFVCNENGKVIPSPIPKDFSPVTDLSGSNLELQDYAGGSNPAKAENAKETEQQDIRGEHCSALTEQVCVPQGIDDRVRQLSQAENVICEAGSNTGETIPTVQNSELAANHISTSPNYSRSNTNASNGKMNFSLNVISPAELPKPVSSDAPSRCLSQGQDIRVVVKAMLSLSEVLLCNYCNDNEAVEECDLKSVLQIIDNLEAVILRNKKGITGSCSRAPRAEDRQPVVKESNADMISNKNFKDTKENKNVMKSGLNNDKHFNILKSFNTNFEESDGMSQAFARVLKSDFMGQEEDPKILLYKNLWVETEATLCSLKHDVALMKLEMGSFKHHFKGKGLVEPVHARGTPCKEHEGSKCGTSISMENPSRSNTEVVKHHKQNILKEDEMDASVIARFRILKGRDKADLADSDRSQELDASNSPVVREKVTGLKDLPPNLADVNTSEKSALQSHNVNKFTFVRPKKNMTGEKVSALDHRMGSGHLPNDTVPARVQESHLSATNCSAIQIINPKNNGKLWFSSGSESSRCSDWEHVLRDEFI